MHSPRPPAAVDVPARLSMVDGAGIGTGERVYPPVALGLVVLALTLLAGRRRAWLKDVEEFPEPSI